MGPAPAHLEEAVRLKPRSAEFRDDLASTLLRRGMAAPAIKQFERALQIDPQDATAKLGLQKVRTLVSTTN
ncbi:MAG: tetratricopeptide repeat protein [Bryobacteraceae bacterium]